MNAGAAAEGRGAASKTSLAGRGKPEPTEGKVTKHKQCELLDAAARTECRDLLLFCFLQVCSDGKGVAGAGVSVGHDKKAFPQTPAGPEDQTDPRTR